MAVIIINESTTTLSINGIVYSKNFQSLVSSDSVRIINVYDSRLELIPYTFYSDFTVDGATYASAILLQAALVEILFYKPGIVAGSGDMLKLDYGGSDGTTVRNSDRLDGVLANSYARIDVANVFTLSNTFNALVKLGTSTVNGALQFFGIGGAGAPRANISYDDTTLKLKFTSQSGGYEFQGGPVQGEDAIAVTDFVTLQQLNTKVESNVTGEPTGSDRVLNIVSLTQAEYDAGTPVLTTLYIITD